MRTMKANFWRSVYIDDRIIFGKNKIPSATFANENQSLKGLELMK
jgi:hypothetical protein